jgi:hypothetical protein
MKELNIKDIITLEDNQEYVITSIAEYEDEYYYYLVDINKISNIKICKLILNQENYGLLEIEDDQLLSKIIPIMYETINNEIHS